MSSHWQYDAGVNKVSPQEGLFDGMWYHESDKLNHRLVGLGAASALATPVTTVGAWFQFVFPRPVTPKHLQFINWNNQTEVYDSGGLPTIYGQWHWEFSENSGGSWTPVGDTWFFREDCDYMIAPETPGDDFALGAVGAEGHGATHWRMVLDAGPAMGGGVLFTQLQFNLDDVTGQAPPYTIAFTDDADGALPVVTIGPPGSPYVVKFTDGNEDGLTTLTFENIPNPVLTIAFTDEGVFDTWSDLYPSIVVQTVVIATGR
jgi:hypothetical protein